MNVLPTEIARTDNGLRIVWSDGSLSQFTARQLRDACPCATCREKRRETALPEEAEVEEKASKKMPLLLPVLSAQETRPVEVRGMKPVGNYAYNIAFSDGHDSGLFTFDFLQSLSPPAPASAEHPHQ